MNQEPNGLALGRADVLSMGGGEFVVDIAWNRNLLLDDEKASVCSRTISLEILAGCWTTRRVCGRAVQFVR
jgi:hypothetical protein